MNNFLLILLICGGLAALVVWVILRRKKSVPSIEKRVFAIKQKRTESSGLQLWIEDGCLITDSEINAVQRGLGHTFDKSRCRGYENALSLGDYTIAIVEGEPDSLGDPAFRIPAGSYAGTIYDKGGYILVAGQVIAIGQPFGNIIVIPEHNGNLGHLSLICEFEAEHVVLAFNDGDEYERTKFHGNGAGHPIIPNCPDDLVRSVPVQAPHWLCGDSHVG